MQPFLSSLSSPLIWLGRSLFFEWNDLISFSFIANYNWWYKKPGETRNVNLELQFTVYLTKRFSEVSINFKQASYPCESSSFFFSLRKVTSKNLPLVPCFGENKTSAEIQLPYHLGAIYARWLALTTNVIHLIETSKLIC